MHEQKKNDDNISIRFLHHHRVLFNTPPDPSGVMQISAADKTSDQTRRHIINTIRLLHLPLRRRPLDTVHRTGRYDIIQRCQCVDGGHLAFDGGVPSAVHSSPPGGGG